MSDQKFAREYVSKRAQPCPCCGASLLVAVCEGAPEVLEHMVAIIAANAKFYLFAAEDAEEAVVNHLRAEART